MAAVQSLPVLDGLRGSAMQVPSLDHIFEQWTRGINPLYPRLLEVVNSLIDTFVLKKDYARKIRHADLAKMTSQCYPEAEWDRLVVMGQYFVFLFIWDDAIDKEIDLDEGDLASDLSKADTYRAQSTEFVKQQLKLASELPPIESPPGECEVFRDVAPLLVQAGAQIGIPQLARDIQYFMDSSSVEQRFRLEGHMPTVSEYWSYRHGTGAIGAICSMGQYMMDATLPDDLRWNEHVLAMREEAGVNTILLNDLLSLRKEMDDATPLSMIPVLIEHEGKCIDKAVEYIVEELTASAERFNKAAEALKEESKNYSQGCLEQTKRFTRAFEGFQTGIYYWTIESPRYGIKDCQQRDGGFSIPL